MLIIFDFSSGSSHRVTINGVTNQVVTHKKCDKGHVFDPFTSKCRCVVAEAVINPSLNNTDGNKRNVSEVRFSFKSNCTLIWLNKTEFIKYSNGTILVISQVTVYGNGSYHDSNHGVIICSNFSSNYSEIHVTELQIKENYVPTAISIISTTGSIVSLFSLAFLLWTYLKFSELRNFPGKNLLSLSTSLMFFQALFFAAGQSQLQELCVTIAIATHYFLLSSFAWMNVMSYDVAKVFASEGG